MRKLLLLSLIPFWIVACDQEHETFPRTVEIKMYNLDSSVYVGRARDLEYLGNWLVWRDQYEEHFYSGYRIDSKEFIRFAKVGKARDEFVMWPQVSISSFGLGLFSHLKKIYRKWDIDSVLVNEDYFPANSLLIEDSLGLTFTMIQRKDSSFISTGANEFGLFAFFDKKGKLVGTSGEYPEKNIAVSDKVHAINKASRGRNGPA